ncbi:hypothetical protein I550_2723 [Mycobacterium intracellulare 1956]|uniref:Uncharacterized protein n=1 Tax=Mycobacterium intracellulare 1956 TaxID=1299331 RepID=X8CWG1_MYCIT|nr:hypothetical protein I550_2723 [Mycobacterium intracellulare 1956]
MAAPPVGEPRCPPRNSEGDSAGGSELAGPPWRGGNSGYSSAVLSANASPAAYGSSSA